MICWIVSELYYPEDTSTGYFLTRISEGLAKDFTVKVICSQPTYSSRGLRAPSWEIRNGIEIFRCFSTTLNKDILLFKIFNLITICIFIFIQALCKISRGDVVFVVTNPPLLPFLLKLVCKFKNAYFIPIIHDVYPEVLFATGFVNKNSCLGKALNFVFYSIYQSRSIVVLGRDMKKLVSRKRSSSQGVILIPHWGDFDFINPAKNTGHSFRKRLNIEDKFVIQYCGNIGRTHDIESILECACMLKDNTDIHFVFIGFGAKKHLVESFIATKKLPNCSLVNTCPREDLGEVLCSADLSVLAFIPGMSGISVPSRMYNVLASGRPILAITDPDSELALVVEEEKIGWVIPPLNATKMLEAIEYAQKNPNQLREMGKKAREVCINKYSVENVVKQYSLLVTNIDNKEITCIDRSF